MQTQQRATSSFLPPKPDPARHTGLVGLLSSPVLVFKGILDSTISVGGRGRRIVPSSRPTELHSKIQLLPKKRKKMKNKSSWVLSIRKMGPPQKKKKEPNMHVGYIYIHSVRKRKPVLQSGANSSYGPESFRSTSALHWEILSR